MAVRACVGGAGVMMALERARSEARRRAPGPGAVRPSKERGSHDQRASSEAGDGGGRRRRAAASRTSGAGKGGGGVQGSSSS